jgi:hypothetical protein
MRNPKFKQITPNYRKRVLEVVLREGKRLKHYSIPFAVFAGMKMGSDNRFTSITIDAELAEQGATFVLEDGTRGDFPADFVLYYSDPTYQWSPINQLKGALKSKISDSKLSLRVLADALNTSPSQVVRLLQENHASKQFLQLFKIAQEKTCRRRGGLTCKGVLSHKST